MRPEPARRNPSTPTGPQIWRMQRLIEWLRTGDKLTTRLAAKDFEVSRRTVASDLEYLRMIGAPVAFDHSRETYYLTEPFGNLPLLTLRRTELAAFLVAQHALEALGDVPHARLLESVAERLAEHLPDTIRVAPEALSRTIRFEAGPHPPIPLAGLDVLETAVQGRNVVRIRYLSNSTGHETERDVEPYTLLSYQGRWYVLAFCRLRSAMRDFRIDRIRALTPRKEVFDIRDGFDLDAYLGPAFGMHRGERTYAVHVRFKPYQARWIREETWHGSQIMAELPDGSLDVRMQVAGLTDLTRWVLSYGAECEVLSPPVLRHRIAAEARRMAEVYGPSHSPPDP